MKFIFDPSLVLYLPLYEQDGSSLLSRDAYGHVCTVTGALWRPGGRYFDGVDDRIYCGDSAILDLVSAFTLEIWVKTTDTEGVLLAKRTTQSDWPFVFYVGASVTPALYADDGSADSVSSTSTLSDVMTHVVVTRDETTINFFFNGQADAGNPQTLKKGSSDADAKFAIGAQWVVNTWNNPLIGNIGEARIYSRVLTPQEIQHNYLATKWRYQ